ncbi:hypothetical protein HYPSUDRAFT_78717, partial [Hypholoma sublateritium FD-334 SS-4]
MDGRDFMSSDSGGPAKPKPKIFSMAQSQALLESRRLNTSYLQDRPPEMNNENTADSGVLQRRSQLQAAPRISLTHFLSNPAPRRPSTPLTASRPLSSSHTHNIQGREVGTQNDMSSPAFTSYDSPESAYIQQIRPGFVAPDPQSTLRLSTLQRPTQSRTTTRPLRESLAPEDSPENRDNVIQYFNSTISRNQDLQKENQHLEAMNIQLAREVTDARARLNSLSEQLQSANSDINTMRPALASVREQLAASETEVTALKSQSSNTAVELAAIVAEHKSLEESHTQERLENERLRATVGTTKDSIARLRIEYANIEDNFKGLKKGHDSLQSSYADAVKEAEGMKLLAKQGLAVLRPMLDDNNIIARASETKTILMELQNDLTASHQVTDLLRNKLHHQGCQLADAQSRIVELESEKRGVMQEFLCARQEGKDEYEVLVAMEKRMEELSARLSAREQESMGALTSAATNEIELKASLQQIAAYEKEIQTQSAELQSLRVLKAENVSGLLALQDVINARDKDIISTRAEIRSLNESKSELRALLAESKKSLADKDNELQMKEPIINAREQEITRLNAQIQALKDSNTELRTALADMKKDLAEKTSELKTRDPNEDLAVKLRDCEANYTSLKAALEVSQEQCIMLERMAKQQEIQLGKKLQDAEKENIEKSSHILSLKEMLSKIQVELKSVREDLKTSLVEASQANGKCHILEQGAKESRESRQSLLADNVALKGEITVLLERLNAASNESFNAVGKYTVLENTLKKSENASKVIRDGLNVEVKNLKSRLDEQTVALFQTKEQCALLKEESASLKERIAASRELQDSTQAALNNAQLLGKSQESRASAAENTLAMTRIQAEETKRTLEKAQARIVTLSGELKRLQDAVQAAETSFVVEREGHSKELKDMITELQAKNSLLAADAEAILLRYRDGRLTNSEREFVGYLMSEAQSIHEEDAVRKANELRRREHTIQTLNSKVTELQMVVARVLKEKGGQSGAANNSLVSIKAWLSSSPERTEHPGINAGNGTDVPVSDAGAPMAPPDAGYSGPEPGSDSEDDVPLSELTKLPTSPPLGGQRHGTKRAHSPAAEEPEQSTRRRT